jgi:hypothetical protein
MKEQHNLPVVEATEMKREKKVIVEFNIKTQILKNGKIVNYLHGTEHRLQE